MIKKLHVYIIKEFCASFFFGLAVFSMLLLLDQVFQLVDLFLSKGVAFFLVIKLFALILPNILTLAIPMAVLFGVLIAYGRLSEDNEITAMKANCVDYKTLSVPVIAFVCGISFFLIFFNHFWSPVMHKDFRNLFEEIVTKRPLVKFDEKTITNLGDYQIYANKVDSKNNTMAGVNIYKFESKKKKPDVQENSSASPLNDDGSWRIAASSASVKVYLTGVKLTLYNGYWQRANPSNINSMIHMTFKSYDFFIPLGDVVKGQSSSLREMSSPELAKTIKKYKDQKFPAHAYESEYWMRWIFSIAPIAFVLIALPIGIMAGKGGKAIGFGMSLGVILFYYMLLIVAMNLGERGYAPVGFIMWIPNISVAACGLYLFTRMVKR
ncbi:MAG: LptF/LptG family permease [Endomicrobia bacterium]|nr:LptF/LptG family permease [Endomicrobiia bacterium]MCL2506755.1 LptF/LptG family permease [Endomicrobiia bacterium]